MPKGEILNADITRIQRNIHIIPYSAYCKHKNIRDLIKQSRLELKEAV